MALLRPTEPKQSTRLQCWCNRAVISLAFLRLALYWALIPAVVAYGLLGGITLVALSLLIVADMDGFLRTLAR